jgi:prolycopene isomerase
MREDFDTVVVGAGIAGLGVAALLAREAGEKVLVLDRFPRPGGRLMSFPDTPQPGWKVDVGLHMTELGEHSSIHALNARAGVEVSWGPFSETVEFYHEGRFVNIAELVPLSGEDRRLFGALLGRVAAMRDEEIAAWDDRSLADWLAENVREPALRDLFTCMGMIMTTIPEAGDMAAG